MRPGHAAALACALAATCLLLVPMSVAAEERDQGRPPVVTLVAVPSGTDLEELAEALPGAAVGIMSAGLGRVPAAQTWLDIGQGARTWGFLHDGELPLGDGPYAPPTARDWQAVVDRAKGAPAPLVPGLLAGAIRAEGLEAGVDPRPAAPGAAAIVALDVRGRIDFSARRLRARGGLVVRGSRPPDLRTLRPDAGTRDMLIAVSSPPAPEGTRVPVAIAGEGFHGLLTSRSTRIRGYVLATDLAPTILDRLVIEEPPEMEGSVLDAEGPRDVTGLLALDERIAEVGSRRASVAGLALAAWLLAALAWWLVVRGPGGRAALAVLALACVYLPALLLLTAALRPSLAPELAIVLVAGPGLALGTLRLLPGWGGLALACAVTVVAQIVDLVAGSALTALSLLGPNPAVGARSFGIGNELVATYGVLVPVGTGAAIAALAPRSPVRAQVAAFAAVGLLAALVLGAGALGASVGAAIVLAGAGAAAALAVAWPVGRLGLLFAVAAPLGAVGLVAAGEVLLGGDAHLGRLVLDADGGLEGLAETAERRLRLTARSFARAQYLPFLGAMVPLCALAVVRRRTIRDWLAHRSVRAGYVGGIAATILGTLANDSGAMLLIGGFLWLAMVTGFAAWTGAVARTPAPPHASNRAADRYPKVRMG